MYRKKFTRRNSNRSVVGPTIVCLDLEGVLTPEVWINVAKKTKIKELMLTTRDIPNYNTLMKHRLKLLDKNKISLKLIQKVIAGLKPLPGAKKFLDWLRNQIQVIILSDTYYEFAKKFMEQLGLPTLFCHSLEINNKNMITGYKLRIKDSKRKAVKSLKKIGFKVIAVGDSFNDVTMLKAADIGIFYKPPKNIAKKFPKFLVTNNYNQLKKKLSKII
ncbi:bifunctional phosphoserine phosphatase/homoserine phosphotransferase ThrH [Candidatus Margulisiibacteriota bacterium]